VNARGNPPPHSEEAEMGVVGSILLDPAAAIAKCADYGLAAHKFYNPALRELFTAANDYWDSGGNLDLITFTQFLRDKGTLEAVGGEPFVTGAFTFVPSPAAIDYYIRIVLEKHVARDLLSLNNTLPPLLAGPDGLANALEFTNAKLLGLTSDYQAANGHRNDEHAKILDERRFDSEKPPPPVTPRFKLLDFSISTPGNLTAIQAQAKGGKTAVVTALIASTFPEPEGDCLGFSSANPEGLAVIHFDTEQSPADHHAVILTARGRAGAKTVPSWLRSYRLADLPVMERRKLLRFEMKRSDKECGGIFAVLLDGGADLLIDPNDPAESFSFVDELHQLAIQYSTVILSVIHENPSGAEIGKTRGHFGSQLERKTETNLRLAKDKDDGVTTIYSEKSRHAHIPKALGPRFVWSEDEHMHVTAGPKPPAHRPKTFDDAEIIEIMNGRELGFQETFKLCKERGWKKTRFAEGWERLKEGAIQESLLNRGKWSANGQ